MDRERFLSRMIHCRKCLYFGIHERKGNCYGGCGLLNKPCSIEQKWKSDSTDWCPIGEQPQGNNNG